MHAQQRREAVLSRLRPGAAPVSASVLAGEFGVSRQIIVGDIALLRAAGHAIRSTPRGYIREGETSGILRTVAVNHPEEAMEQELTLCVDNGCTVLDVAVEHPVYGLLVGQLQIASRYDVAQFLRRVGSSSARPLSELTSGIHLHTLRCPDEAAFQRVCDALDQMGYLLKES
ncbi:MAG: transcription repressor NadR [Oscillospiraceae bacterium]|nr:transcription repressor NadR [Oscillospiraceae bacterium]